MQKHQSKTHHYHHHQRREALKQGSLEGLIASLPVFALLKKEELDALSGITRRLWNENPKVKEVTATAERKYGITAPMIMGAVVIGGAVLHGALRGIEKARHDYERQEAAEAQGATSFREREDIRRSYRSAGRQH
jgi:hypothetical protein